jgi:hypothetical protein
VRFKNRDLERKIRFFVQLAPFDALDALDLVKVNPYTKPTKTTRVAPSAPRRASCPVASHRVPARRAVSETIKHTRETTRRKQALPPQRSPLRASNDRTPSNTIERPQRRAAQFASAFRVQTFKKGDVISAEGSEKADLFVLATGECRVLKSLSVREPAAAAADATTTPQHFAHVEMGVLHEVGPGEGASCCQDPSPL